MDGLQKDEKVVPIFISKELYYSSMSQYGVHVPV
jgi:hypothetical protein